jgi:hypothetical protein
MQGSGCTGGRHCGYAGVASRAATVGASTAKRRRGRDCDVLARVSESVRQAVKLTSGRVHIETLDSLNPMSSSRVLRVVWISTAAVEQRRPKGRRMVGVMPSLNLSAGSEQAEI